jgi:membrane associated rhomboid family serine protease
MGNRDYNITGRSTLWNTGNPLVMLIILNILFFILLNFIKSVYTFTQLQPEAFYRNIYHWFVLSAEPGKLLSRPWTLLTMQFSELKTIVVISNLIWLWTFGHLVQDLIGGDKLFPIYIYGAFVAGLSFFVTAQIAFPDNTASLFFNGPSAGILALAIAATTVSPTYKFFPMIGGGIPLWIITIVYVALNGVAFAASPLLMVPHFSAAVIGFVFIKLLMNGNDTGSWMNRLFSKLTNAFTPKKKGTASLRTTSFYQQGSTKAFIKKNGVTQERIDMILDKINQKGYENLTEEEKTILKKASKEDL